MKVLVRHGHFSFYPSNATDVLHFQRYFKLKIVKEDDYYTFESLLGLPRYSLVLQPYGLLPATATYEGRHAWEVMRENSFVYSLVTGLVVPLATMIATTPLISLPQTLDYAVAPNPLIQPGAMLQKGGVLTGYEGYLDMEYKKLYVYSVEKL